MKRMFLLALAAGVWTLSLASIPSQATRGRDEVRIVTRFDNAYVYAGHPDDRHLEIEVIAPDWSGPREGRRPPLNIALVIDRSGSMAEAGKMEFVRKAAAGMVDRLRYGDRFSVVAYDDHAEVLVPSEPLEDRHRAKRLIMRMRPGGSTNLGAGLVEGYNQVRRHFVQGGINRVLLLSDGLANRGMTSPGELSRIVGREGERGVTLSTFGVGLDFNEDLLASLSEGGRGTYYYIDQPHRIGEILAREFSFIEQVVALDVSIFIEVTAGATVEDVMGYRYRREGGGCRVSLGDMAGGERRKVMVRLAAPSRDAGDHRVGEVSLSYRPQGGGGERKSSEKLKLHYVASREVVDKGLDREVSERTYIYEANSARRKAAELADDGDLAGARQVLDESSDRLRKAPVRSEEIDEEIAATETYGDRLDEPMSPQEKEAVQKDVKYKSYRVLQSK